MARAARDGPDPWIVLDASLDAEERALAGPEARWTRSDGEEGASRDESPAAETPAADASVSGDDMAPEETRAAASLPAPRASCQGLRCLRERRAGTAAAAHRKHARMRHASRVTEW